MFLNEVLGVYVERKQALKPSSREQIEYSIKAFERHYGRQLRVEAITDELLADFVRARSAKCVASTVARNLSAVMLLVRFAIMRLKMTFEMPYADPISEPVTIPTAWTIDEMSRIIQACSVLQGRMRNSPVSKADWWTALLLFLYYSGARITAALSLSVSDIDPQSGTAMLRGEHSKTGHEQVVSLGPETVSAILQVIAVQGSRTKTVFDYPWSLRKIWIDFRHIMDAARVRSGRYIGFHRIRKTHATQQVISHGWEQARVALGHSSESMTRRYVDVRQIPRLTTLIQRPKLH